MYKEIQQQNESRHVYHLRGIKGVVSNVLMLYNHPSEGWSVEAREDRWWVWVQPTIAAAGNLPIHPIALGMRSHSHVFGVWVRKVTLVRLIRAHQLIEWMAESTNIRLIHAHNSDNLVSSEESSCVTCTLCGGYLNRSVMRYTQRNKGSLLHYSAHIHESLSIA